LAAAKKYREAHPGKSSLYFHANKDRVYQKQKEWKEKNREYISSYHRKYREKNAAWFAEYNARNAEHRRRKNREWMRANAASVRARALARNSMKQGASGAAYTKDRHIAWRWEYYGNRCYICGAMANATDHVKPLRKGGSHYPVNLRPICRECNSTKKAKWIGPHNLKELINQCLHFRSIQCARKQGQD
jgi:5-methylcytosine-specific restriction endonuclease McrA